MSENEDPSAVQPAAEVSAEPVSVPTAVDVPQAPDPAAAAPPLGTETGQTAPDVLNEASAVAEPPAEPVAPEAPQTPPAREVAPDAIAAPDAQDTTPAAQDGPSVATDAVAAPDAQDGPSEADAPAPAEAVAEVAPPPAAVGVAPEPIAIEPPAEVAEPVTDDAELPAPAEAVAEVAPPIAEDAPPPAAVELAPEPVAIDERVNALLQENETLRGQMTLTTSALDKLFLEHVRQVADLRSDIDELVGELGAEITRFQDRSSAVARAAPAGEHVRVVLRRPAIVGGEMRAAGDAIGTVTLGPGISLNFLVDAVSNGLAKGR